MIATVMPDGKMAEDAAAKAVFKQLCTLWPTWKGEVSKCPEIKSTVVTAADAACQAAADAGKTSGSGGKTQDAANGCKTVLTKFTDFVLKNKLVKVPLKCADLPTATDLDKKSCKGDKVTALLKNCARSKKTLTESLVAQCAKLDGKKTTKIKRKFLTAKKRFKGCLTEEQLETAKSLMLMVFKAGSGTFEVLLGAACDQQTRRMRRLNSGSTTDITFETTEAEETNAAAANQAFDSELEKSSSGIQADGDMEVTATEEDVLIIDEGTSNDPSGTDTKTDTPAINGSAHHVVLFSNIVIVATALIQMVW
jgi:hypothetical protein